MADRHDVQLRTKLLEKIFPSVDTVDNLESDNPNRPLSARQGKVLKELINAGGSGGSGLSIEVVESLPATGVKGILYLVPKTSYLKEENTYDEYVWIESSQKYELLGSFSTDLNIEEYVNKINSILGEVGEINVATLSDYGINSYVTTGTYRVHGERINSNDGLPILNAANGHTVEGILKVYNSSIAGTGKNTDKVVTQMLSMSNRHGGDGHIWIRTGQGASEDNLTWSTWEKMQGIFEKNTIENISELNTFTTNGIYSCMYIGNPSEVNNVVFYSGDTLLIVVVNGYMASSLGKVPHLTQTIIHLTAASDETNSIITRSAIWEDSVWKFSKDNDITLKNFHGNNAYIGRIYISSHVNDNSTLIQEKVKIGPYVAIGTYCDEADWIKIAECSQLIRNTIGFTIRNTSENAALTLANNTKITVKGGKTSSVEYKQANTMVIDAPSVTLGHGGGSISIGSGINIANRIIIGDIVNIGDSVSIGKALDSTKTVSIGTGVYINSDTNIGLNVSIGETFDLNKSVSIGTKVYINGGVNIGNRVKIGNDVVIEGSLVIGTSDSSKSVSIGANVHIKDSVNIKGTFTSGNEITLGDSINIGNRLTIGNDVHVANNVAIGEKVSIGLTEQSVSDLVIIGTDVRIGGNVHIGGGFDVVKNTPNIGTITFNENNILFQVGSKFLTLQLSEI